MDQEWEAQCKEADAEKLRRAAKDLHYSIVDLETACDTTHEAALVLTGCVEYDRVMSILQDMEQTLKELKKMRKEWKA